MKSKFRIIIEIGLAAVALATLAACGAETGGKPAVSPEDVRAAAAAIEGVATAAAGSEELAGVVSAAEAVATAVADAGGVEEVEGTLLGLLEVRVTDAPPEGFD